MNEINACAALPIIFAACDELYFRKHARGFARSALLAGHCVHIIVSPAPGSGLSKRARNLEKSLKTRFMKRFTAMQQKRLTIDVVADQIAHEYLPRAERIVFYQSLRFMHLPEILRRFNRPVIVLDIDSLVLQPILPSTAGEVGLYLRLNNNEGNSEHEVLGKKVLAAMVYATPDGIHFFERVIEFLLRNARRYYVDQLALFQAYQESKDVTIFDIAASNWLDWCFNAGSLVWTAKGRLKRRNITYVKARLELEGRSLIMLRLILLGYKIGILRR